MHLEHLIKVAHATKVDIGPFEKCRPFVFPADYRQVSDRILRELSHFNKIIKVEDAYDKKFTDVLLSPMPFEMCSFELAGEPLARIIGTDEFDGRWLDVYCIIASEKTPEQYDFYAYFKGPKSGTGGQIGECVMPVLVNDSDDRVKSFHQSFLALIKTFNMALADPGTATALEGGKRKFKVGSGKSRRFVTIKNVIHIYPKKERNPVIRAAYGGPIDFSHRFEVRGHWRRIDGIGKNRGGEYSVQGFTWVVPHERGPKDKPLVRKTRVVDPGSVQETP